MFWCKRCFTPFTTETLLEQHKVNCQQKLYQIPKLPKKGEKLRFIHLHYGFKWPFALYCDFECILIPVVIAQSTNSTIYQHHVPCSFSITVVSIWKEFETKTFVFSNENPEIVKETFIKKLKSIRAKGVALMKEKEYKLHMTAASEKAFQNATECFMCGKSEFSTSNKLFMKVRDHDHFKMNDNYRGAAHSRCNWGFWLRSKKFPVILHNSKGYVYGMMYIFVHGYNLKLAIHIT